VKGGTAFCPLSGKRKPRGNRNIGRGFALTEEPMVDFYTYLGWGPPKGGENSEAHIRAPLRSARL
jgi:hypothetical protein